MFPTRKFRKLKLVQSLSQRKMQPSMASNFLKVSKPLSLNLLVYFETLQTATVSTTATKIHEA